MKKQSDYNSGIDGIDLLRAAVRCADARNEDLNCNKTPLQLINDYIRTLNDPDYDYFTDKKYNN